MSTASDDYMSQLADQHDVRRLECSGGEVTVHTGRDTRWRFARCRVPDCDWNLHSEAHDIIDTAAEDHGRDHDGRAGTMPGTPQCLGVLPGSPALPS